MSAEEISQHVDIENPYSDSELSDLYGKEQREEIGITELNRRLQVKAWLHPEIYDNPPPDEIIEEIIADKIAEKAVQIVESMPAQRESKRLGTFLVHSLEKKSA